MVDNNKKYRIQENPSNWRICHFPMWIMSGRPVHWWEWGLLKSPIVSVWGLRFFFNEYWYKYNQASETRLDAVLGKVSSTEFIFLPGCLFTDCRCHHSCLINFYINFSFNIGNFLEKNLNLLTNSRKHRSNFPTLRSISKLISPIIYYYCLLTI